MKVDKVIKKLRKYTNVLKKLGISDFFIAGNSIASLILNEKPSDIDIWFNSEDSFQRAVAKLFEINDDKAQQSFLTWQHKFREWNPDPKNWKLDVQMLNQKKNVQILEKTMFAISFEVTNCPIPFHFIDSYCGEVLSVLDNFDFLHTKVAYSSKLDSLIFAQGNSIDFIQQKALKVDKNLNQPIHTLQRIQKFINRGYRLSLEDSFVFLEKMRGLSKDKIESDPLFNALSKKDHSK